MAPRGPKTEQNKHKKERERRHNGERETEGGVMYMMVFFYVFFYVLSSWCSVYMDRSNEGASSYFYFKVDLLSSNH